MDYFKGLLLEHAIHRPPYSICVFSLEEVKLVSMYAMNTYFRHYYMYKYCFTKKVVLDLDICDKSRERDGLDYVVQVFGVFHVAIRGCGAVETGATT